MVDEVIKTGVDELITLVTEKRKISINEAAKILKVSPEVIQSWVDFLVEEKILGIEYKFTTPFIYMNKGEATEEKKEEDEMKKSFIMLKQEFGEKAKTDKIPDSKIEELWKIHLLNELKLKKAFFYNEAAKRNLKNINIFWERYTAELLKR